VLAQYQQSPSSEIGVSGGVAAAVICNRISMATLRGRSGGGGGIS